MKIYVSYPMSKLNTDDYLYDILPPPKFIDKLEDQLYVAAVRKDWVPEYNKKTLRNILMFYNMNLAHVFDIRNSEEMADSMKYLKENIEYLYTADLFIAYIPFYSLGVLGEISLWKFLNPDKLPILITTKKNYRRITSNVWWYWISGFIFAEDEQNPESLIHIDNMFALIEKEREKLETEE